MLFLTIFLPTVSFCFAQDSFRNSDNLNHLIDKEISHNDYDPGWWREASRYLRETMNPQADPCEDFYEHVCGNFGTKNSNRSILDMTLLGQSAELAKLLIASIENIDLKRANTSRYEKAIRVFYDQCTSVESEPEWPKNLYEAIASRLGEFPYFTGNGIASKAGSISSSSVFRFIGSFQREFGSYMMIRAQPVPKGAPISAKFVLIPATAESSKSQNTSEVLDELTAMFTTIRNDTYNLGDNPALDRHLEKIQSFYEDWVNATSFASERETYRMDIATIGNISNLAPSFDWRAYSEGYLPDGVREQFLEDPEATVVVLYPNVLANVSSLLEKHGSEVVRSFAFMAQFDAVKDQYFGEVPVADLMLLRNVKTAKERCLEFALKHLSPAIAKLYFKFIRADIMQWRQDILMLGRNIFSAFRFLLNNVDWLDAGDKEKVQEKVDEIAFYPGIPSWINDEEKVISRIAEYDTNLTLFENDFRAMRADFDRTMRKSFKVGDKNEDEDDPNPQFAVNAQYNPDAGVSIHLGMIVPPFYSLSYPLAVKYGGLGSVIGHELMHAFDARNVYQGAYADQEWLKESSLQEFEKKKRCLVRQYSTYCYEDKGVCVRGDTTISDNIADIDGLKVAFTAFKFATQVFGNDPPIPGMLNYTYDQLFFMTAARFWCSTGWSDAWESGPYSHTPPKPRVEIMIRNVLIFARAFNCKVGSKYAPLKRCSIWGDLANPARMVSV